MIYGFIKNGICVNIAVFDTEEDALLFKSETGEDLVLLADNMGIGDLYSNGIWSKPTPVTPEPEVDLLARITELEAQVAQLTEGAVIV